MPTPNRIICFPQHRLVLSGFSCSRSRCLASAFIWLCSISILHRLWAGILQHRGAYFDILAPQTTPRTGGAGTSGSPRRARIAPGSASRGGAEDVRDTAEGHFPELAALDAALGSGQGLTTPSCRFQKGNAASPGRRKRGRLRRAPQTRIATPKVQSPSACRSSLNP